MTEPLPWTRLYNRIKAELPAAPDALIRQEIFQLMIDFTQDTNIWIEEVPLDIQPNVISYPFIVEKGTPYRLILVFNPNDTTPSGPYRWADNGITMRVPGIIRLWNKPTETKQWVAVISKACATDQMDTSTPPKPTGYPEIDDWIVDQYTDIVVSGTLAYMQRMPGKPWRDPKAAAENQAFYQSQKSQARLNNMRSNVYGGQTWTYPQNFATITRKGWQ
jgi:hypothetical protein